MTRTDTVKTGAMVHSGRDLVRRRKNTAAVLTDCRDVIELDDGYALTYPATDTWKERLDLFQENWRAACPHMSFEVARPADREEWRLEIRGPDGTKDWVVGARHIIQSNLSPAPTLRTKMRRGFHMATSPLRVLPNFLIIGGKKCGTTSLYSYLTAHPDVFPASQKELYYFHTCYHLGIHWYKSYFPTVFTKALHRLRGRPFFTGEATPDYLLFPSVAERVQRVIPDVRLIAILRNPIDRAYSYYNHNRRAGLEACTFDEAVDQEEERLAGTVSNELPTDPAKKFRVEQFSYKTRGLYADQLKAWGERFPREQLLVLSTEELQAHPEDTLRQALDHLGLPYHAPAEFKKLNAAPYPDMEPATRRKLSAFFRPHNERLYEFLGRDLGWD